MNKKNISVFNGQLETRFFRLLFMKAILISILICYSSVVLSQSNYSAAIWLPQNSGWAMVNYTIISINNDSLYVTERKLDSFKFVSIDSSTIKYKYDTMERYSLNKETKAEFEQVLANTDSLGHHSSLKCSMMSGKYRFMIYARFNEREMSGFLANCYRKHIFDIVDIFNKAYPNGYILAYNKVKLKLIEENGIGSFVVPELD